MATVVINEKGKGAKGLLELLKTLSYVTVYTEDKEPTDKLINSIIEARKGQNQKAKNAKDLMKKLRS